MNCSLSTLSFRSLLITVVLAAPALAQDITPFVNGTPANATVVNTNFTNLKTAVQAAQTAATGAAAAAAAAQTAANAASTQTSFNALSTTVTNQGNSLTTLTNTFAIDANNRVCIGNNAPGVGSFVPSLRLGRVSSSGSIAFAMRPDSGGFGWLFDVVAPSTSAQLRINSIDAAGVVTDRVIINDNGNVGIGTVDTGGARLTVSGVGGTINIGLHSFLQQPAPITGSGGSGNVNDVTISASNGIHAQFYRALSDARIKSIVGRSDGARDLDTLTGIEITDYTYKDTISKGGRLHKKVIAQQVESVYPPAVSLSTDIVPDIYQRATQSDGWVTLATDLKVGERVRLIGENAEGVHEVLEVRDGAFRTAFVPTGEKVFVYGREVKDFRSVDYEAISMLNVSATQELARKVVTLTSENEALKTSLEAMAGEIAALKTAMQPLLAK